MEKTKIIFLIEPHQIILLFGETIHVFAFNEHEIVKSTISNPTKIKNMVRKFLRQKRLEDLPGIVVFCNNVVQEQLVASPDLHMDLASRMYVKSSMNQSLNYLAMLEPELLLQYQILFGQIGIYVELFTTLNLLHIKNLLSIDSNSLNNTNSLDELHLVTKSNSADLYLKIVHAVEKISNI